MSLSNSTDDQREPMCYLHIGTHKTGTTAIQTWLADNAAGLREAAIHIPRAGRSGEQGGHHNLAWEFNADERFERRYGTFADVVDEIAATRLPFVCLSSEDFEYLHVKPAALQRIRSGLAGIGYAVTVVVYLRPQASYAESLYAELVKHGFTRTFDDYLAAMVRDGSVSFGRSWRFAFDYAALIQEFSAIFGASRTIVRPYTGEIAGGSVVRDFSRVIGSDVGPIDRLGLSAGGRVNASAPFIDVLRTFAQNLATSAPAPNTEHLHCRRALSGRFDPVRLPEVARIAQRFAAGNRWVFEHYGVAVPYVSRRDLCADISAALGFDAGSDTRRSVLRAQRRPGPLPLARSQPASHRSAARLR